MPFVLFWLKRNILTFIQNSWRTAPHWGTSHVSRHPTGWQHSASVFMNCIGCTSNHERAERWDRCCVTERYTGTRLRTAAHDLNPKRCHDLAIDYLARCWRATWANERASERALGYVATVKQRSNGYTRRTTGVCDQNRRLNTCCSCRYRRNHCNYCE